MTATEINAHLADLDDGRPHVAGRANEALGAEFKRLQNVHHQARMTGEDTSGALAELRSFAAATGNERWTRKVERTFARPVTS